MDDQQKLHFVKDHIGTHPDFPRPGILFRDVFTALTNGTVCQHIKHLLISSIRKNYPDVELIVGLESRGFLFNLLIASELGIGCAPIRKKGKLPGECLSIDYTLEYGVDSFEIQKAAIQPQQKVLLIDDLLATGGSIGAAVKLLKKANAHVLGALVVIELADLNGRQNTGCDVHSLIQY